jgi:hypothetical protein
MKRIAVLTLLVVLSAGLSTPTRAQETATENDRQAFYHNPRIAWRNINMSPQERLEAGIWQAYLERPFDFDIDTERTTYHRIPEDDIREALFKIEILKAANEIRAQRVLVMCGAMHAEPLKMKLEGDGHETEINDESTPVRNWR